MALQKFPCGDAPSVNMKPLSFLSKVHGNNLQEDVDTSHAREHDLDVDLREVYFLIMHFLSAGPCRKTCAQFWNELLEHQILPRRYHAWYSRKGLHSGDGHDDGQSFPLNYDMLVPRYPHIEQDHLVKLLKQMILSTAPPPRGMSGRNAPNAADVPTLLGTGTFSLLSYDKQENNEMNRPAAYMRWPHIKANQVHGLGLREIGGGFTRHHRAPSVRAASYAIAKPSTMFQKMKNTKRIRGHRNAVYCAIFDRSGRYVITGSDDRLVKIWLIETAFCLASCRGHEGDITDLAVSSNNTLVASASNDCIIRVWRLPDGLPISVLRGHTGAVTAIAFNPRPGSMYHLLSSSDDGTCRIWDARNSQLTPRIYIPKPSDTITGRNSGPSSSTVQNHQIFCCAFNANGTVFVTGSSDTLARVWSASKPGSDESDLPNYEIDVLSGHENDVNYVQFSGCAVVSRFMATDTSKEENVPKFKNSWFNHDNIVTCSRDGSAIIWIPKSRRSHGKAGRWTRAYHLKVPPPPMPPQPPQGGPRQRILPTPRGVNMISWSLDNRFVLAAIMDCRICVWNASDGSLVHSLTGHTDSTYVLDVHPFNPRLAMSAGYDGKTIVWDIWEGIPIRIHQTSQFRLVDGKFSPDGTSIILSDDVGQLYILDSGQGESHNDAKYDQFFLGDYRPIIQDSFGNVLDQETQLPAYRRNMQDLLCDSGMIPYPEPYQNAYQKRRLGALGSEWRPSSLRLAVGPDFSLDPDFQMLPLANLDMLLAEPLPEFVDAMDWEPENEMQSDDADSEYNITEDYSTGGEQGSLSSNPSIDPECSAEDSDEDAQLDGLRRSRRKKLKADVEVMTSSGRCVKRRNLDECDDHSFRSNRTRKSGHGRKTSKKKCSTSKSLRPQRLAARNALTLFSKITGRHTEGEDEDGSEGEISGSESTLQDFNIESDGSNRENDQNMKGKQVLLDESVDAVKSHEHPELHRNAGSRGRLVLKLPRWPSNTNTTRLDTEGTLWKCEDPALVDQSCSHNVSEANENHMSCQDLRTSPGHDCSMLERTVGGQSYKVESYLNLTENYKVGSIRWGGSRARTSKRLRVGEPTSLDAFASTSVAVVGHSGKDYTESEKDYRKRSPQLEGQRNGDMMDGVVMTNGGTIGTSTAEGFNGEAEANENSGFSECKDHDQSPKSVHMAPWDASASSLLDKDGSVLSSEQNEKLTPVSTKLRVRKILTGPESPREWEMSSVVENLANGSCSTLPESLPSIDHNSEDNGTLKFNSDQRCSGPRESDTQIESVESLPNRNKMFSSVYRRVKSHRGRSNIEGESRKKGEGSSQISNIGNQNLIAAVDCRDDSIDGTRQTRSMGLKTSTCDPSTDHDLRSNQRQEPRYTFSGAQNNMAHKYQLRNEEQGSSSRTVVGLRSTRNRRSYYDHDMDPVDKKKSHQSTRKGTWLMLAAHEESSRYIPQLGDEVVYLRQGHQEYFDLGSLREDPPWAFIEERIRAVEFCKVQDLEYSLLPGSGDSCCKLTLEFVDPSSEVYCKSFKMTLPEVTGFPDFIVEKTRYVAAIEKKWSCRDKCKVWWKNDGDDDGSWWDGRIVQIQPKAPEFPDSPWEMCTVLYKTVPKETQLHSPWELFDNGIEWVQPQIDNKSKNKLHSALAKLEKSASSRQDSLGINKLKQLQEKPKFTNWCAVPVSLDLIQSRLENDYYRSLEALKHDFKVMLLNAQAYVESHVESSGKTKRTADKEFLEKLQCLSGWFTETISSL
ncbi:uncharacterized protein LOC126790430 [Argentina anserina]|uniref:uncharacterized protein LOC126790430 n=1 Tax=Argentina anserina TaxID=57926 RepID=UPI0021767498|nr:uncharacterized protein LOC126790430 [Potentilla anserina]